LISITTKVKMKLIIIIALFAFVYCDLKSDLLKRAEDLQKTNEDEIKKLESANRTSIAPGLQHVEEHLKELAKELQSETGPEAILLLENELNLVEQRLSNELRALTREGQTREELLAYAVKLEGYIMTEEDKLKAEGNAIAANRLQSEYKRLESISTLLKTETNTSRIATLEVELRLVEIRVTEQLRRLGVNTGTTAPTSKATDSCQPTCTTPTTPTTRIIAIMTARPTTPLNSSLFLKLKQIFTNF